MASGSTAEAAGGATARGGVGVGCEGVLGVGGEGAGRDDHGDEAQPAASRAADPNTTANQ